MRVLGPVLLGWAFLGAPQSVGGADQNFDLHYQADTLTLRVEQVPVQQLLEELSRQTGARVVGTAPGDRLISAEFSALPLPIALSRVLGPQSFALRYRSTGELQSIHILGTGSAPSPGAAAQPSPTPQSGVAAVRRLGVPVAPPAPPAPGRGGPPAGAPSPGAARQPTPPQQQQSDVAAVPRPGAPVAPPATVLDEPPTDAALSDPAYVPSDGANLPGERD